MKSTIELMAVSNQHPAAFRGAMDEVLVTFDSTEKRAHHVGVALIMIAGHEDDPRAAPPPCP